MLQTITVIEHRDGRTTSDTHYYLSSLPAEEIDTLSRCVRRHWAIESVHWVLDVTLGEDASRIRKGVAAENFATLRRISYALLRTDRDSIKKNPAQPQGPPQNRRLEHHPSRKDHHPKDLKFADRGQTLLSHRIILRSEVCLSQDIVSTSFALGLYLAAGRRGAAC